MSKGKQDPSRIVDAEHARIRSRLRKHLMEHKVAPPSTIERFHRALERHDTVVAAIKKRREAGKPTGGWE